MQRMNELLGKVSKWYGYIPPLTTPAFTKFLSDAGRLIKYVANTDRPIKFRFANVMTAGADLDKGEVVMPLWVLDAKQYEKFYPHMEEIPFDSDNALMTAVFTGLSIHEAGHHRWTKFNKMTILKECFERNPAVKGRTDMKLATSCIDMIEDLYIEQQIREQQYGLFIDALDEFLFSEEMLVKFMGAYEAEGHNIQRLLGAIFCYKNTTLRMHPLWNDFTAMTEVMDKAPATTNQIMRGRLAADLYILLKQEMDEQGGEQSPGQGTASDMYDGGSDANADPQMKNELSESYKIREAVGGDQDLDEQAGKIEHAINELMHMEDEFNLRALEVLDVLHNRYRRSYTHAEDLRPAKTFANLGRILALLKSENITPGVARKTGQRIVNTRLTRIVTDSKIFGEPRRKIDKNDREVILLVDHSGSMSNRIEKTMQAARGAFDSLRQSGTPCAVYGHTCRGDIPTVYHVASFRMNTTSTQLDKRWQEAAHIGMEENYDGVAIEYCAKQFSKRNTPKILVVFCDGLPTGPGYRGNDSDKHTLKAIQTARKHGVLVFAVSLVPEIIENNNKFYGRRFNIDASHGNVDQKLRDMLLSWGG